MQTLGPAHNRPPRKPGSADSGCSLRDPPWLVRRNATPGESGQIENAGSSVLDMRQLLPAAPRLYLVSDVRLHREGLISILGRQSELNVVGAGCSGNILSQISAQRPDILLLDLTARDSLIIPRRARHVLPTLRVVAFAVADAEESLLACAEAGISGYVVQDGSVEDLVTAVLRALKGEVLCSPQVAALLFNRVATLSSRRDTVPADAALTSREREIAALVASKMADKEIARRLGIGPATIKTHVHHILQKLNIHRRGEIAALQFERSV